MLGFEYRWLLLNPLVRGALLSLGIAGFCACCLFLGPQAPALAVPAPATLVAGTAPANGHAAWPRAALRLWVLVPQLLPVGPR